VKEAYGQNFCTSEDFTPTCQTNPHLIALLLDMCLGCFSIILKQDNKDGMDTHNHFTDKKYVSLANQGLK
jgi:hypothetical protein